MMRTTHFKSQCDAHTFPADSRSLCPGSGVALRADQSQAHDQPHPRQEVRRVNPSQVYRTDDAPTNRQARSFIARLCRLLIGTIIVQACIRPVLLVLALACVGLASDNAAAAADGNRGAPPMLVTADMLHAKIGEAERNPELDAKGRAGLIALYHDALSNLKKNRRPHCTHRHFRGNHANGTPGDRSRPPADRRPEELRTRRQTMAATTLNRQRCADRT
jgi:hypothetical protein